MLAPFLSMVPLGEQGKVFSKETEGSSNVSEADEGVRELTNKTSKSS